MITDKNALSIGESIGWKKLVGQEELPKLSCELSGSKGREHREDPLIHTSARTQIGTILLKSIK